MSDLRHRLQERQETLEDYLRQGMDRVDAWATRDRQITPYTLHEIRTLVRDIVDERVRASGVHLPYAVHVTNNDGRITIRPEALPTDAERAERERQIAEAEASLQRARTEHDRLRNEQYAKRARTVVVNGRVCVDIEDMIEDLAHWDSPPRLGCESAHGFHVGVRDVTTYLAARHRRHGRT